MGNENDYFINIENGIFSWGEGKIPDADINVIMDPSVASGIFAGTVNAASAYMAKELKFEGSMMTGMKFKTITDAVAKIIENS